MSDKRRFEVSFDGGDTVTVFVPVLADYDDNPEEQALTAKDALARAQSRDGVQWTAIIEEHSASSGRLIPRTVITFMFADMVDGRIAEALDHLLDNHCDEMWEAGWNTEHLLWLLPTHRLVARAGRGHLPSSGLDDEGSSEGGT